MSNPLLALLNRAGSSSAPSPGGSAPAAAPPPFASPKSDAVTPRPNGGEQGDRATEVRSPPAHDASALLQNLLRGPASPQAGRHQPQPAVANPSAPASESARLSPSNAASASAASDLLGLLSGPGPKQVVSPNQNSATTSPRAELGAQSKSTFGFSSPFDDLLAPSSSSGPTSDDPSVSVKKEGHAASPASAPAPAPTYSSQTAASNGAADASVAPIPQPSAAAVPKATSGTNDAAVIRTASEHLASLHQQKDLGNSATSGLAQRTVSSNTTVFDLELTAPQPGGVASLHPAKLEATPLALLAFPLKEPAINVLDKANMNNVLARVPASQVANLGADIIAYAMKKGRVRVLHTTSGDRLLLQVEGGGVIRSINASPSIDGGEAWYISAISTKSAADSDARQLSVWKVSYSGTALEATVVSEPAARLARVTENDALASHHWNRAAPMSGKDCLMLVCEAQKGQRPAYSFATAESTADGIAKSILQNGEHIVGSAFSVDGSVAAVVSRDAKTAALRLTLQAFDGGSTYSAPLADLPLPLQDRAVSCVKFIDPCQTPHGDPALPRALLVGFASNAVIGLYDLQQGQWRFVWNLKSGGPSSFNVVEFDHIASTIHVANSARASLFLIPLQLDDVSNGDAPLLQRLNGQTMAGLPWTVQVPPSVNEVALPEPLISFALARGSGASKDAVVKVFSVFPSGTQMIHIPAIQRPEGYLKWSAPSNVQPPPPQAGLSSSEAEESSDPITVPSNTTGSDPSTGDFKLQQLTSSSDSDLDGPRAPIPTKPSTTTQQRNVREQEAMGEWDATTSTFSQLVSSESSLPTSPALTPARAAAAATAAGRPRPQNAASATSSPQQKGTRSLSKSKGKKSQTPGSAAAAAPAPAAAATTSSSREQSVDGRQPPAAGKGNKTILSRPEAGPVDAETASGGGRSTTSNELVTMATLQEAVKGLDATLTKASSSGPAATGQLSAAALSAISSEVSASLSIEVNSVLRPQILEAVRSAAQSSMREAFVKDLQAILPGELKAMLGRPGTADALTQAISKSIIPNVQKTVKDVVSHVVAPHFEEVIVGLTQSVEARIESGIADVQKSIVAQQSTALQSTAEQLQSVTSILGSVVQNVETLTRRNEALQASVDSLKSAAQAAEGAPRPPPTPAQAPYPPPTPHYGYGNNPSTYQQSPSIERWGDFGQSPQHHQHQYFQHRQASAQHFAPPPPFAAPPPPPFGGGAPMPAGATPPIFGYSAEGQAPPPPPTVPPTPMPGGLDHQVEDSLLSALSDRDDPAKLMSLLTRLQGQYGRPELALRQSVSQPIILSLLHRLCSSLDASKPTAISVDVAVPWAEAAAAALDVDNSQIAPAYAVVAPKMRNALVHARQAASTSGTAGWWTEERLQTYLLRFLR